MVQKRSFVEDLCEVSRKHPRQLGHSSQLVSFLELPSEDVVYNKPHTSGGKELLLSLRFSMSVILAFRVVSPT